MNGHAMLRRRHRPYDEFGDMLVVQDQRRQQPRDRRRGLSKWPPGGMTTPRWNILVRI
jgi:hypothetical protein